MIIREILIPEIPTDSTDKHNPIFREDELNEMKGYVRIARPEEYFFVVPELALKQRKEEYKKLKKNLSIHAKQKIAFLDEILKMNGCYEVYAEEVGKSLVIPKERTVMSKGYWLFKNRLVRFREDCEFAEAVVLNRECLKGDEALIKKITKGKFPMLYYRQNNPNGRTSVAKHLRNTTFVAFIKEIYEEVAEYFRYILKQGALNGVEIGRLVGNNEINLKANEILSKTNMDEVVDLIMKRLFRQLENERSTTKLIAQINNKLGLSIEQHIINNALPYLEARHIFVHADGKPDKDYLTRHQQTKTDSNGRIKLDDVFIRRAYSAAKILIIAFDREMADHKYLSDSELQSKKGLSTIGNDNTNESVQGNRP